MLAVWAMNLVQARVRPMLERERVGAGAGFTQWPPAILGFGAGFCGSQVVAWRTILEKLGMETRELGFTLSNTYTHVGGEVRWGRRWRYFDVQAGAFWEIDGQILPWRKVRDAHPTGLVWNQAWSYGRDDYLAYLVDPELQVEVRA